MDIRRIIRMSRPRFWLYLAGTFMVGYAFGIGSLDEFLSAGFIIPLLIFLIPANMFIYGINDIADRDTDRINPKKDDEREARAKGHEILELKWIVSASAASLLLILLFLDVIGALMLFAFIFLGAAYSVRPLRLKSRPLLDFMSNSFYMLPGIIGYYMSSGMIAPISAWMLGISWTGAMHLFSAVPDIEPDRKAGIMTSAVLLGYKKSLLLCIMLWAFFVLSLIMLNANILLVLLSMIYIIIPLALMFMDEEHAIRAYWHYPYINGIMGMLFFFYAIIPKI